MAKIIKVDKDGAVLLNDFSDVIDTAKVTYYSLKKNKDGTLGLKFYNKKKKLVKPHAEK